jgi:uncharacterized protein YbaR (Trm112 family)
MLNASLLEILVCPNDRGSLRYYEALSLLENPRTQNVYDVVNDIAVLLPQSARPATPAERLAMDNASASAIVTGSPRSKP